MANTKISQLPTWTGSANDLRWFVMNNSGETETYKFSGFTSQLIPGTGTGETYRTPTATASGADSIAIGDGASHSGGSDGIAIGKTATSTSNRSTAIGGTAVAGGAATALGWGCSAAGLAAAALGYFNSVPNQYGLAVGSSNYVGSDFGISVGGNNYMAGGTFNITLGWDIALSSGSYNTMIGGKTNTFTSTGFHNNILGGSGNTFSDTYGGNVSIGGDTNIISGTRGFKTIINGSNNEITGTAKWSSIFGGRNNRINDGDYGMTIIGGEYNYLNGCNYGSAIIATASATMTSVGTTLLAGGYGCSVSSTNDSASLGGRNNVLSNNYQTGGSANIVGEGNNLTGNLSAIIGGNNNTITGGTHQVMLGCSGRTATDERTTYVENLKVFGQAQSNSNNVGSISSGTTLDFNTGNIQYFQLTSGSTIVLNATNYKDGATYIVKVKQPSSGTNATMTFTSPLFKFPNGVAPTLSTGNNEEDILSFICIGATLYGNIQKTFI